MIISVVASVAKNNAIGLKDKILWRLPHDLVHLKNLTLNQVTIIGMKTYKSMEGYYDQSGRDMPAKMYLVITAEKKYKPKRANAMAVFSPQEAVKKAQKYGVNEVFVIGGGMIFNTFLPLADKLYLTEVNARPKADVFFPEFDKKDWVVTDSVFHPKDERHAYSFNFRVYERKK